MNETRKYLNQYAMLLGTYLGVFWIAKFCLIPSGMTNAFLMMLFIGLTLCVPFMAHYYTRLYRDRIVGGYITFAHAWLFYASMFIYASLLTAVAHYIYLAYMDNGHIIGTYNEMLNQLKAEQIPGTEGYISQMREGLELLAGMKPIDLVMQQMSNNIFMGLFMGIITAMIIRRKNPKTTEEEQA